MKVAVFSSKDYDIRFLQHYNHSVDLQFHFFDGQLNENSVKLASGFDGVCVFVNDQLDQGVIEALSEYGVRHIALRCAGFNNVDLKAAAEKQISVSRVPEYSPQAVAEHTLALMLTLNRKLHKAYNRVKEDNFSLNGLLGFNFYRKTVGIIGTGRIGLATMAILKGLGCELCCYDPYPCEQATDLGAQYVPLDTLLKDSDVISLHCPLTDDTHHLIDPERLAKMKDGVMLINTSRGALLDTPAVIQALKKGKIGYLGLDVYEMESELFFEDKSEEIIQDDDFQRLLTFPNVLITGHQGFFTQEAMEQIAQTTIANLLTTPDQQGSGNFLTQQA